MSDDVDARLRAMYNNILGKPEAKKFLHQAIVATGQKGFADIEAEDRVNQAVTERTQGLEKQYQELQLKLMEREANERVQAQRDALKRRHYTAKEIEEIEKLMVEKGLTSHDDAVILFEGIHNPLPTAGAVGRIARQKADLGKDDLNWRKDVKNPRSDIRTKTDDVLEGEFDKAYDQAIRSLAEQVQL